MKKLLVVVLVGIFIVLNPSFPVSASEHGYCHSNDCYHYLGSWVWDPNAVEPGVGGWIQPNNTIGSIDLRGVPEMVEGTDPPGWGFFVTTQTLGPGYFLMGTNLDNSTLPALVATKIEGRWEIKIEAKTIRGILWEMFVEEGDPTQQSRWGPLQPRHDGTLVVNIGGYSDVVLKKDIGQSIKGSSWRDTISSWTSKK